MYSIETTERYESRLKRLYKKHPDETSDMLNNLDTYMQALKAGTKPVHIRAGWIHNEPKGVKAIDQGRSKGRRQTRLYIYPDEKTRTVHLITVGDKKTQKDDIQDCNRYVDELLRS